jgi:hypothetical protein
MNKVFSLTGLKTALPWLTIIVGVVLLTYGHFADFSSAELQKYTTDIGKTILAGGFFAVLLKTYQFMGVFKDELSKIVWETKYLANRHDLHSVWEDVSKLLFRNKFPGINHEITRDVKNLYFPTEHIGYYDNYKQTLNIDLIDPDAKIVKVTQQSEYTVYPSDAGSKVKLVLNNTLLFNRSRDEVSFRVMSVMVNGSKHKCTPKSVEKDRKLHTGIELELSGCASYKVETEFEKTYCLKHDDIIGFRKDTLIHDFNLKIFTKGVEITFLSAGTLNEFKRSAVKKVDFAEYEYKGIIYPKQGYMIFIRG